MDLSNRDAEHLIGSAWNKENRVPNTVSLPLEITCPAFAGMHSSRPRYEISIVLRNFTQVKMCSHTNCFASTKRTTFQRKQVHIFTWLTQLPLQVNSMCRKCIGKVMEKSRWRTFISYQSERHPQPPFLISFEGELRKEHGSRGSRRWFLSEADSPGSCESDPFPSSPGTAPSRPARLLCDLVGRR